MGHDIEHTKKLQARVRRIEGQLQSLSKSLDAQTDGMETLQQIASIRGALHGLMQQVLEGQMTRHLMSDAATPAQRQAKTQQVLAILRSYLK